MMRTRSFALDAVALLLVAAIVLMLLLLIEHVSAEPLPYPKLLETAPGVHSFIQLDDPVDLSEHLSRTPIVFARRP